MSENRIEQTTPAGKAISPTGSPLLSPKMVPWLMVLVAVAEAMAQTLPPHTVGARVAHGAVALGVLLGLASPGLRAK